MTDRTPTTAAGRDFGRLTDLRDAIIEAVQTQDGIGAITAFAAYDDFIEAEARAEPPRIVTLAWDATAEDVARIRRDWEAAAEARAPLDVERLAKALAKACPWHLANEHVPCAPNVAREYAALEEPTP